MKKYYTLFMYSFVFITNGNSEILKTPLDLTWYFENNTIYWLGVQPFTFTKMLKTIVDKKFWLAMNEFCAGEHGGTHMDAPYHFNENGIKLGQIPIKNFITRGILIDVSKEVERYGSNFTLQPTHILQWIKENGPIHDNTLVLVKFGWSQFYPTKEKYLGPGHTNGTLKFPGISPEAAELFTKYKLVGVGVDTASIDPGFSKTFDAHQILNGHGLYLLENVKLLETLPPKYFTLVALPMNIAEGTGAPVRLVAVPADYL